MLIPQQLYGLNEVEGKSAESRFSDAKCVRQLVQAMITEDNARARQRALVKGMLDGNPPFNEAKRKSAGLQWTANLNFMEGEALISAAQTPYYHLFSGAETYVTCRTRFGIDDPNYEHWNDVMADRFSCLLDRWREFDFHMAQHQYWMLVEGYAPVKHVETGWKFHARPSNCLLFPKGSDACLDDRLPYLALREPYRAHELLRKIEGSGAEAAGWNPAAVKWAIQKAAVSGANPQVTRNWEYYQKLFKNNDLYTSYTDCDIIWCANFYYLEKNGKVSHCIVTEGELAAPTDNENGFLYRSVNKYDHYQNAVTVFFQNLGDGTFHSVRGLAMKAFKHLEASNRLKCRVLDGAFMESGLVLQGSNQTSQEQMQVAQIGPVTWIPSGAEVKQTKLAGFLDGAMAADRMLTNHLQGNLGQFRITMSREDGRGEVPTAEQIRAQVNKEAALSQGQITLYYLTLDTLYEETFNRAVRSDDDEAKRFREECMERGVPLQALKNMEYVRANRMSGYGSNQMRMQANAQMMEVLPMLPENGKNNFLNDYITGVQGPDKVERYNPKPQEPTSSEAWAILENSAMKSGDMPVLVSGQSDVTHLQIHLADAKEELAPLQQAVEEGGADPAAIEEAANYIEILAPHCEAHLQRIVNDASRSELAKMFQLELRTLVGFHGKLRRALIQAQNEARQAQMEEQNAIALGALDEAKLRSMEADIARKDMKAQADIQLKATKAMNNERLKTWEATQENRRTTLQTAQDMRLKRISTQPREKAAA